MPSSWHDSVTAIFTEHPELAVEIAASLNGALVPRGVPVRVEAPNLNDRPSTDFEADAVIVAGPARDPVRAVIVEAQKRTLTDKPAQCARYAAQLSARRSRRACGNCRPSGRRSTMNTRTTWHRSRSSASWSSS